VRLLSGTTANIPPAVYGEVIVPGQRKPNFYAHYDGQPVQPCSMEKGLDPLCQNYFLIR
jgi:hypothetical protein